QNKDENSPEKEKPPESGENNNKPGEPYCGSCYGAEQKPTDCCNTCESVREAYRKKGWAFANPDSIEQCNREGWTAKMNAMKGEGCQIYGHLQVNKVAGNFHFAPGKSFQQQHMHVHDLQPFSKSVWP